MSPLLTLKVKQTARHYAFLEQAMIDFLLPCAAVGRSSELLSET